MPNASQQVFMDNRSCWTNLILLFTKSQMKLTEIAALTIIHLDYFMIFT